MARAKINRSDFSPEDWRGLARHLRELALGEMDDATRARINKHAHDYELTAERLEKDGKVDLPSQKAVDLVQQGRRGFASASAENLRKFRRMLKWRPRRQLI